MSREITLDHYMLGVLLGAHRDGDAARATLKPIYLPPVWCPKESSRAK